MTLTNLLFSAALGVLIGLDLRRYGLRVVARSVAIAALLLAVLLIITHFTDQVRL